MRILNLFLSLRKRTASFRRQTRSTTWIIGLIPVACGLAFLALGLAQQSDVNPGLTAEQEAALWHMSNAVLSHDERQKQKTPEQLLREQEAVAEFSDPWAHREKLQRELSPQEVEEQALIAFSIQNPVIAKAAYDQTKSKEELDRDAAARHAILNPSPKP